MYHEAGPAAHSVAGVLLAAGDAIWAQRGQQRVGHRLHALEDAQLARGVDPGQGGCAQLWQGAAGQLALVQGQGFGQLGYIFEAVYLCGKD